MRSEPSQDLSKASRSKKITKVRPRKKSRVILGILGDARSDPLPYITRWVVYRGAE